MTCLIVILQLYSALWKVSRQNSCFCVCLKFHYGKFSASFQIESPSKHSRHKYIRWMNFPFSYTPRGEYCLCWLRVLLGGLSEWHLWASAQFPEKVTAQGSSTGSWGSLEPQSTAEDVAPVSTGEEEHQVFKFIC